jgi:hypothetical protein
MSQVTRVFCSTCFALPGELCRTKYVAHGQDEVTPVICPTHPSRLADSERESSRDMFARLLCALAISTLEQYKK